jgi:hypothetical protein
LRPGHIIFAIGGGSGVPRSKGGTALHPHVARDDGCAVGLIQKWNGDIGVKLTQLEIRRVKDMTIMVVIGVRSTARKPHAETIQRGVDACDGGGENCAIATTLIRTTILNGVEPQPWLTDVLEQMVGVRVKNRSPASLLPWAWRDARRAAVAA